MISSLDLLPLVVDRSLEVRRDGRGSTLLVSARSGSFHLHLLLQLTAGTILFRVERAGDDEHEFCLLNLECDRNEVQ